MMSVLKVVVSLGLLAFLGSRLDWSHVWEGIEAMPAWAFIAALVLQVSGTFVGNWRWWTVLDTHALGYSFRELLPQYFIGSFFSILLPTSTGGDLFRMYFIYRQGHGAAKAVSPVIIERVIGLVTMVGLATFALLFVKYDSPVYSALSLTLPPVFLIMVLALAALGLDPTYWPVHRFIERWTRYRLVNAALGIAETVHDYLRQPGMVVRLVMLTVLLQITEIVVFYILGRGVGADLPLVAYAVAVPMMFVVSSLPITVGGLGVRELAAVELFRAGGMATGQAATIALLFIPILLLASLPGLVAFLRTRDHRRLYEQATHSELAE